MQGIRNAHFFSENLNVNYHLGTYSIMWKKFTIYNLVVEIRTIRFNTKYYAFSHALYRAFHNVLQDYKNLL